MVSKPIKVLLVDDNPEIASQVSSSLNELNEPRFEIVWKTDGSAAVKEAEQTSFDAIVMDYFLPGINGLEVTQQLKEKGITAPVIFLTVNRDMGLAVEAMKRGVADYLLKEDLTSSVFPKAVLSVIEKQRLRGEVTELEIKKKRLEAMQEFVAGITKEISEPIGEMKQLVSKMSQKQLSEKAAKYLTLIEENVDRLELKLEKLKNLKEDKTVQYIRDIKMIDLS